ncbi:hypothetical protein [Burkholderia ubonensis]|nr:hypothetical protein [Burkholderia ubonensis]
MSGSCIGLNFQTADKGTLDVDATQQQYQQEQDRAIWGGKSLPNDMQAPN